MSISPLGGQERLRAAAAAAALRANSASRVPSGPGAPRQPDAVSISDPARSLAAAHQAVVGAPDVREDRVSALKAAIADGTYTVDSRNLARKLLSS
ncbi:MAG TPA: flagellar biosynthesis anti-sigma factor FlgM [Chloroflexota bacterium]|nr:flagellar biosynthesis anti-sigma factor FlgM [Chloroflexota bacterium]